MSAHHPIRRRFWLTLHDACEWIADRLRIAALACAVRAGWHTAWDAETESPEVTGG